MEILVAEREAIGAIGDPLSDPGASGEADTLSGCYVSVFDDLAGMVASADDIRERELYTLRLRTPG